MRVYVACPVRRVAEARRAHELLGRLGHQTVSRWVDRCETPEHEMGPRERRRIAEENYDDLFRAHAVLAVLDADPAAVRMIVNGNNWSHIAGARARLRFPKTYSPREQRTVSSAVRDYITVHHGGVRLAKVAKRLGVSYSTLRNHIVFGHPLSVGTAKRIEERSRGRISARHILGLVP